MQDSTLHDSDWWVAENELGEAVAYAGLYTGIAGEGWMVRAGVVPTARGRKLQRRLLHVRVRRARKLGLGKVYTYTVPENLPSNRNLAAAKFTPYRVDEGMVFWYRRLT